MRINPTRLFAATVAALSMASLAFDENDNMPKPEFDHPTGYIGLHYHPPKNTQNSTVSTVSAKPNPDGTCDYTGRVSSFGAIHTGKCEDLKLFHLILEVPVTLPDVKDPKDAFAGYVCAYDMDTKQNLYLTSVESPLPCPDILVALGNTYVDSLYLDNNEKFKTYYDKNVTPVEPVYVFDKYAYEVDHLFRKQIIYKSSHF